MKNHLISGALTASALSLLLASSALAQQSLSPEAPTSSGSARLTYGADFFVTYNPQTAQDIVNRVPGFSISGGGGGRGLAGNLGNVLIDGRRPSSKDGINALLSRIPAASVERVELIREPVPGIDMAGQDEVVNVVTNRSGGWDGAWNGRLTLFESGRVTPSGEVSTTRSTAQSTLTFSINLDSHARGEERLRIQSAPDGVQRRRLNDEVQESFFDLTPSLAWRRDFDAGHALRVDARVWTWRYRFRRDTLAFDAADAFSAYETGLGETTAYGGEATVDYDHALSDDWNLKFTALQRLVFEDGDDLFSEFDDVGAFAGSIALLEAETEGETVLRAEARRSTDETSAWIVSAEGAYNFLDGDLDIFSNDGTGPVPVALPISETRVEEHRVDLAARRVWSPSQAVSIEGGVTVELSRIAQTGDAEKERTFTYFKPELNVTWTLSERDQLRFTAERDVGQLSFGDFLSSVNVTDDTAQLGNPELEPERTWRLQADWERRFAETGVVTLLVRHEWVEGVEDLVPVQGLFDAPGNLPDGRRWRVEGGFTTPLDAVGIPGGELSASAMVRRTEVEDPVTAEIRRFRGDEDWRMRLDFRQDRPEAGFSWGWDYYVQAEEDFYRIDTFDRVTPPRGDLDLFAETNRIAGLTARIGVDLNLGERERQRLIWPVSRAQGDPAEIELQTIDFDGRAYFELSGVF